MTEALGEGWRSEIHPQLAAGLRTRVPVVRTLLGPFVRRRLDVQRISNLGYGDGGRRQRPDPERADTAARLRRRGHLGGCRDPPVRLLRPDRERPPRDQPRDARPRRRPAPDLNADRARSTFIPSRPEV